MVWLMRPRKGSGARPALLACRDIEPHDEIFWAYGPKYWSTRKHLLVTTNRSTRLAFSAALEIDSLLLQLLCALSHTTVLDAVDEAH